MSYTCWDYVEIRRLDDEQHGVFARVGIPQGTVLGVFGGEAGVVKLSNTACLEGLWWEQSVHLKVIGEELLYLMPTDPPDGIDFLNHSCRPNVQIIDQLISIALDRIPQGEQLFADYRTFDLVRRGLPCWCAQPRCTI